MSTTLAEAATRLRRAALAVENTDSRVTAFDRAATELDRLGFFRTDVALAVAELLDAAPGSPNETHAEAVAVRILTGAGK